MSRFRHDRRGLSEIIGSLMLILIVVGAAVALAAFVASYEKQLNAEEALQHQRELEDLKVLSAVPEQTAGTNIYALNLTITSLDVNPTILTSLRIDEQGVSSYNATEIDPSTGLLTWVTIAAGGTLTIGGFDVVNVVLDAHVGSSTFSFYDSGFQLATTDYLQINMYTALTNDFTSTFVPPTAIALVTSVLGYSGGLPANIPELDGQNSFQPGNGTLVSWAWAITFPCNPTNETCWGTPGYQTVGGFNVSGEDTVVSFPYDHTTYAIALTVVNTFGLVGVSDISYVDP